MSNHRLSTTNVPSSSAVQIAFDSNPTPHHCGYCNTNGSCTAGLCLSSSISLREIRSSNCGYCQVKRGKFSLGKNGILGNEGIFFFVYCELGLVASIMLVDDYQILMDRGWRK
jgi:hypothetical protein